MMKKLHDKHSPMEKPYENFKNKIKIQNEINKWSLCFAILCMPLPPVSPKILNSVHVFSLSIAQRSLS
jgi:hypothetical protein